MRSPGLTPAARRPAATRSDASRNAPYDMSSSASASGSRAACASSATRIEGFIAASLRARAGVSARGCVSGVNRFDARRISYEPSRAEAVCELVEIADGDVVFRVRGEVGVLVRTVLGGAQDESAAHPFGARGVQVVVVRGNQHHAV